MHHVREAILQSCKGYPPVSAAFLSVILQIVALTCMRPKWWTASRLSLSEAEAAGRIMTGAVQDNLQPTEAGC